LGIVIHSFVIGLTLAITRVGEFGEFPWISVTFVFFWRSLAFYTYHPSVFIPVFAFIFDVSVVSGSSHFEFRNFVSLPQLEMRHVMLVARHLCFIDIHSIEPLSLCPSSPSSSILFPFLASVSSFLPPFVTCSLVSLPLFLAVSPLSRQPHPSAPP
jgi:hypothetical protein